jgi:hypothetical protein
MSSGRFDSRKKIGLIGPYLLMCRGEMERELTSATSNYFMLSTLPPDLVDTPNHTQKLMKRLSIHLLFLALLCLYFFTRNNNALFLPYDGAYMRQLIKFNLDWTDMGTGMTLNPLQGLGSFNFPINYWLSPATTLSYVLHGKSPNSVLIYTFITLEFFVSMWILASALGTSITTRLVSSWLGSIMVMPFIVPMAVSWLSFYLISGIVPYMIELLATSNVILALIIGIQLKSPRRAFVCAALLLALVVYSIAAYTVVNLLSIPLAVLLFVVCLFIQPSALVFSRRTMIGLLIFSVILICPFLFFLGLLIDTVPSFFNRELITGRPPWEFISILFHGPLHLGWGNSIVYLSGLLGGIAAVRSTTGQFKKVAILYLSYCMGLLITGLLLTFVFTWYRGPSMLYFEWFLWPFMFIYGVFLFEWLFAAAKNSDLHLIQNAFKGWERCNSVISSEIIIPTLVLVIILCTSKPHQVSTPQMPPKRTSFVSILQNEVALSPGSNWRGSVATFNGSRPAGQGAGWGDSQAYYDVMLWFVMGNDHRAMGLWWYNIPTLFSYNQCMPPDYYYVATRFFATPRDEQQRSVVVLTNPDTKLLGLFGVRFIITDKDLGITDDKMLRDHFDWQWPGATSLNAADPAFHREQFLYELKHPNLGNYSPCQQVVSNTADDAARKMRDPAFNPEQQVIVIDTISEQLLPAAHASLVWKKNEVKITATSSGTSLLVLPLAYSNCLKIKSRRDKSAKFKPKLVRADIALTGILFSGSLNATIYPRFGPYDNVLGKITDYLELKRMKM